MNFSMTIENATVSTVVRNEYEIIRHIEACFLAAGYDSDTFAEYLAHYLELYHEMTVLPEKEYTQALAEAREEAYDEGFDDATAEKKEEAEYACNCPMCKDPVAYDAGWNDGFQGEENLDEDMAKIPAYMVGYENGKIDREKGRYNGEAI